MVPTYIKVPTAEQHKRTVGLSVGLIVPRWVIQKYVFKLRWLRSGPGRWRSSIRTREELAILEVLMTAMPSGQIDISSAHPWVFHVAKLAWVSAVGSARPLASLSARPLPSEDEREIEQPEMMARWDSRHQVVQNYGVGYEGGRAGGGWQSGERLTTSGGSAAGGAAC